MSIELPPQYENKSFEAAHGGGYWTDGDGAVRIFPAYDSAPAVSGWIPMQACLTVVDGGDVLVMSFAADGKNVTSMGRLRLGADPCPDETSPACLKRYHGTVVVIYPSPSDSLVAWTVLRWVKWDPVMPRVIQVDH